MRAVILAAGRGSRLNNATSNAPKCFVRVREKRLLDWQIQSLRSAGISEIGIVAGYKAHLFTEYNLKVFENKNWSNTEILRSLLEAEDWLSSEELVVCYSDILFPPDIVVELIKTQSDVAISYDVGWQTLWERRFTNPLEDAESFKISSDGQLLEIGASVSDINEIEGQYMGLLKFTPNGWRKLREYISTRSTNEIDKMQITALLSQCIHYGVLDIDTVAFSGTWMEVDTEFDLAIANSMWT